MKILHGLVCSGVAMAIMSMPLLAQAQTDTATGASGAVRVSGTPAGTATSASGAVDTTATTTTPLGAQQRPLPPSTSYNQPLPPVSGLAVPSSGVVHEAGVGGVTAYGRAGVLELGGSMGFSNASNYHQLTIAPSLGWFFMDNVEISGIVGINYINSGGHSSSYINVLAEPSLHIPFSQTFFGFAGLGMGLSYADVPGAGFALAPRAGVNVMVGRSGILTPAFQLVYSTTNTIPAGNDTTLLAVNLSYGLNVGYTVMW